MLDIVSVLIKLQGFVTDGPLLLVLAIKVSAAYETIAAVEKHDEVGTQTLSFLGLGIRWLYNLLLIFY
jgi:hypothetical protein